MVREFALNKKVIKLKKKEILVVWELTFQWGRQWNYPRSDGDTVGW